MPMEVFSSGASDPVPAMKTATVPASMPGEADTCMASVIEPSMVRSETFDCPPADVTTAVTAATRPTHLLTFDIGETTINLSQQLQNTFDVHTSSPNPNATQTSRMFSLGESQILDTSAAILNSTELDNGDGEGGERNKRANLHLNVSGINRLGSVSADLNNTPCTAGTVNGLMRAKLKQSVQHRLESSFASQISSTPSLHSPPVFNLTATICSPVNLASPLAAAPPSDTTISMDMCQLDDATVTMVPNVWNCTEVLETNPNQIPGVVNNLTHVIMATGQSIDSNNSTLIATEDQRMDFDDGTLVHHKINSQTITTAVSPNEPLSTLKSNRFSIGLDLASEFTLDCSIDLCDMSVHSNSIAASSNQLNSPPSTTTSIPFRKQNSFDDSLGILTPDQMKEFLDSTNANVGDMMLRFGDAQHRHFRIDMTPSPEELPLDPIEVMDDTIVCRDADATMSTGVSADPLSDEPVTTTSMTPCDDGSLQHEQQLSQTDSDSKNDPMCKSSASKVSNSFITSVTSIASLDTGYQGDGEMSRPASRGAGVLSPSGQAHSTHSVGNGGTAARPGHMSGSRAGSQDMQGQHQQQQQQQLVQLQQQQQQQQNQHQVPAVAAQIDQIDEDMLDLPPVIVPRPPRVTDPMTDSDFFTESDADDVVNRAAAGDRRAQVIDGHLYGGAGADAGDVYVGQHAGGRHNGHNNNNNNNNAESMTEDSCMESSGIFTDVENRADDDLGQLRSIEHDHEDSDDMSPDGSTDTIKSNPADGGGKINATGGVGGLMTIPDEETMLLNAGQCNMSDSTSSTINSRISDQLSIDTSVTDDNRLSTSSTTVVVTAAATPAATKPTSRATTAATATPATGAAATTPSVRDKHTSSTGTGGKPLPPTSSSSLKKSTITASSSTATATAARKHTKNEANVALMKKHEFKRGAVASTSSSSSSTSSSAAASAATGVARGRSSATAHQSTCSTNRTLKTHTSSSASVAAAAAAVASTERTTECAALDTTTDQQQQQQLENRRPPSTASTAASSSFGSVPSPTASAVNLASHNTTSAAAAAASASAATATRKTTAAPNKWDAVMNKIEANKNAIRAKKYSEVRSKVTCGLTKGGTLSPSGLKRPVAVDAAALASRVGGVTAQKKRLYPTTAKRAHTTSKESSQSDLSLSGGSSKLQASPSHVDARSAKKRDVRALSVSPSDLGPPPKTNGNAKANGVAAPIATTKTATLQKRFASNTTASSANSGEEKCSPPAKKGLAKLGLSKTPLKDHNRLVSTPTSPSLKGSTLSAAQPQRALTTNTAHLSSATLKSSPIAASLVLQPSSTAGGNASKDHTASTVVATAPAAMHDVAVDASAPPAAVTTVSVAVESVVETATKAISANLGCGGSDQCSSGKGVEALGVLLQYLVFHMDAFGNAHWQRSCEDSNRKLQLTSEQLNSERSRCTAIEQQLTQKEQLHHTDMLTAQNKELELLKRISELSSTENELREKVHASETEFGERLRAASMRERDLGEKVLALQRQLVAAGKAAAQQELQWQEKLALCQDELSVMRIRSAQSPPVVQPQPQTQLQHQHSSSGGGPQRMLQDEVESLRCVLELKQNEISELRKQNHELVSDAEALPAVTLRVHSLQSRLEDVQLQLQQKGAEEKDLRYKLKHVEQCYAHETNNRKSVTLHNEQLQWKLMQNSEKFSTTLNELSKHYNDHSDYLNAAKATLYGQENTSSSDLSGADLSGNKSFGMPTTLAALQMSAAAVDGDSFSAERVPSPPSTPVVKGVVEKSESVSWVLEINDDESAEALASRIVRRAGSFRANPADKWGQQQQTPAKKRNTSGSGGVNPLSQSASAASILRHSSDSSSPVFRHKNAQSNTPPPVALSASLGGGRLRSKSVSTTTSSASGASPAKKQPIQTGSSLDRWTEQPICASSPRAKVDAATKDLLLLQSDESEAEGSPKCRRMRSNSLSATTASAPVTTTSKAAACGSGAAAFRRNNASFRSSGHSAGSGGVGAGRSRVLPPATVVRSDLLQSATASMQDSPKFQQIKESAGEAMVSGTNSEDDDDEDEDDDDEDLGASSTGSSDESMSVSSGRTTNSSHSHFTASRGVSEVEPKQRRLSLEDVLMHDLAASRSLDDNF